MSPFDLGSKHMRTARNSLAAVLLLALGLVAGCGKEEVVDNTTGHFSCDATSMVTGTHLCFDNQWEGGVYDSVSWKAMCTNDQGGTVGEKCDRTGAVGGCQTVTYVGGIVLTITTWYYSGREEDLKPSCSGSRGTWLKP